VIPVTVVGLLQPVTTGAQPFMAIADLFRVEC